MNATVPSQRRLIVGISGASGVVYGLRVLQLLQNTGVETHLVMSRTAELTFAHETNIKIAEIRAAAHTSHSIDDYGRFDHRRRVSHGRHDRRAVVDQVDIGNATGVTSTLQARAADVTLKERRRLVLMVREIP